MRPQSSQTQSKRAGRFGPGTVAPPPPPGRRVYTPARLTKRTGDLKKKIGDCQCTDNKINQTFAEREKRLTMSSP